jgi:hypothetical protein
MRGDHLRALDVALSADRRQRPGLPGGLSLDPPIQETGAGFDRVDLVLIGGQVGGVR